MGLFDDIEVQWPLPDGYKAKWFQTKDLECYMEKYRITKEGRLEMWRNAEWADENFHGILNFYDWTKEEGMHAYLAKFTDGTIVSIETYPTEPAAGG